MYADTDPSRFTVSRELIAKMDLTLCTDLLGLITNDQVKNRLQVSSAGSGRTLLRTLAEMHAEGLPKSVYRHPTRVSQNDGSRTCTVDPSIPNFNTFQGQTMRLNNALPTSFRDPDSVVCPQHCVKSYPKSPLMFVLPCVWSVAYTWPLGSLPV